MHRTTEPDFTLLVVNVPVATHGDVENNKARSVLPLFFMPQLADPAKKPFGVVTPPLIIFITPFKDISHKL